ncbi:hypothetical protein F4782DRAFT_382166 [Xylaria castorea]|nr:hypothetical protein F4782DRAFT_382166 [Xylaria castorea]
MNGTIFPADTQHEYGPRWYTPGTPALQALIFDPGKQLPQRQLEPSCGKGQHSCLELNAPFLCCESKRYCYFDENWTPKCCHVGSKCPDAACQADEFSCNVTSSYDIRVTLVPGQTTTGASATSNREYIISTFISHSTTTACCSRACGASSHSCESVLGGQCCGFGSQCALGTSCVANTGYSTQTASCLANQKTCRPDEGGGCCDTGSKCAVIDSGPTSSFVCSGGGPTLEDHVAGLSPSAKAGIGVGVAIGVVIVVTVIAYLSIWWRWSRMRNEKILTEDNQDRGEFAYAVVETDRATRN